MSGLQVGVCVCVWFGMVPAVLCCAVLRVLCCAVCCVLCCAVLYSGGTPYHVLWWVWSLLLPCRLPVCVVVAPYLLPAKYWDLGLVIGGVHAPPSRCPSSRGFLKAQTLPRQAPLPLCLRRAIIIVRSFFAPPNIQTYCIRTPYTATELLGRLHYTIPSCRSILRCILPSLLSPSFLVSSSALRLRLTR